MADSTLPPAPTLPPTSPQDGAAPLERRGVTNQDVAGDVSARPRTTWDYASTALLVAMLLVFAVAHFRQWRAGGPPTGLGLVIEECLTATLFLIRRRPKMASGRVQDWLVAAGGSWLILAVRPAHHALFGLDAAYLALQFAGLALLISALATLGRSFGIVAADRGVKISGPYRIVRHPIYLAYLITQAGYLLQNPRLWNLLIVVAVTACQLARIVAEERILRGDPRYREYARRVRRRLIPALY